MTEGGARRIIVGVSGSSRGLPALRWAADLARMYRAELFSVHAWLPPSAAWAGYQFPSEHQCREWAEAAWQRLGDTIELAFGGYPPGVRIRPVIAEGFAGQVLVRAAGRADDLLVLGTGRRVGLGRLWHGGVCRYCLAHACCPVIAIPPPALEQSARQLLTPSGTAASPDYAALALRDPGAGHGWTGWLRRPGRRR
jgi:nucleotide-binding universal stress UspA family protein